MSLYCTKGLGLERGSKPFMGGGLSLSTPCKPAGGRAVGMFCMYIEERMPCLSLRGL